MNTKFATYFLLLFMLVGTLYPLLQVNNLWQHKLRVRQMILPAKKLITVRLHVKDMAKFNINTHEIKLGDKMFDYVSKTIHKDTVIFLGHYDTKEDKLISNFMASQGLEKIKGGKVFFGFFYFESYPFFQIVALQKNQLRTFKPYFNIYANPYMSTNSPPPWFIST